MRILTLILVIAVLSGCSNTQTRERSVDEIIAASQEAIAPGTLRGHLFNLVSVANCTSPSGNYTTEVHTDTGHYLYFRQEFSYKPEPFEAVILNKKEGYELGDSLLALPPEAIAIIRGHAFHTLLLELPARFHSFEEIDTTTLEGRAMISIRAKDESDKDCVLFFDSAINHLYRLHLQNPGNIEETIKITWSEWREVQGFILPFKVEVDQAGKVFVFDFTKIEINSRGFKRRELTGG